MSKLEQLQQIIDTALQGAGKSKLSTDAIDCVGGFTSPNVRHLMNNLGAISTHYLECGSHVGSTLISTVFGNDNLKSAIGVDNFSLFDEGQKAKRDFTNHCERFIPNRYKLLQQDYFTVTMEQIGEPIDLYLFDGAHDFESQKKGITYYAPLLAKQAIIVVDDFDWQEPNAGTMAGLMESGLIIKHFRTLSSGIRSDCNNQGFWNGIACVLIEKK